jgi:hypothetical protein
VVWSQPRQIVHETLSQKNRSQKKKKMVSWWSGSRCRPWVQTPVLKKKNKNLLEDMLQDIGIGKDFQNRTISNSSVNTARIDNWDYIKLKTCIFKRKWLPEWTDKTTEWEKIVVRYSFNEGLISRIHKKTQKIKHPSNNPINEWANELNIFQMKKYKWQINIFDILSHQRNAHYIDIPLHPSQNG